MDKAKNIIGISAGLCIDAFHDLLVGAINDCTTANGEKPEVMSARLPWKSPAADAPKLIQNGDKKCRIYEEIRYLAAAGAKVVAVPNFANLPIIKELQTECTVPIASIGAGIAYGFKGKDGMKVGYLGDPSLPKCKPLRECIKAVADVQWIEPDEKEVDLLNKFTDLVFGSTYSKKNDGPTALGYLRAACDNLVAKGAEIILTTCLRQATFQADLVGEGYKVIDIAQYYGEYLCKTDWQPLPKPFKVGIVGGLGPLATVDLYDKITQLTPAKNDQEHIKIAIEQNPQVPDRTKCLLEGGDDPTLPLYAACKKLEADDVDLIVFPCNTAHAFIDTIIPHLSVPILNMQRVSAEEIKEKFGPGAVVGLMATTGTCDSKLYDVQIEQLGMRYVKPDPVHQDLIMQAVYGEKGVKAGYTGGLCREQLMRAAEHLVSEKGANVLILGCTELPILLEESDSCDIAGKKVGIVDPTAAVARQVVEYAQIATEKRGRR